LSHHRTERDAGRARDRVVSRPVVRTSTLQRESRVCPEALVTVALSKCGGAERLANRTVLPCLIRQLLQGLA
jgi:hypothetical protein